MNNALVCFDIETFETWTNAKFFNKHNNTMNHDKIYSQTSGESAVKARRYIVGSLSDTGDVSFATNPTTHTSGSDARSECKRLAKQNPGRTFIFVQLVGAERAVVQPSIVSI